ncbi:class E sortase [Propioniciclava soli]|uniref:Class E sortase n=1 Tax=Propioniciclava soli TaxID=2775081 RepID=A0ABZ3C5D6_9ACTN
MSTTTRPQRAAKPRRGGRVVTAVGVICLVLGLGVLGWSSYDLFWNPLVDPQVAAQERAELREQWEANAEPGRPLPGDAVALLRIPAFGDDFEQPVLVGADLPTLKRGLGWYEGTAEPGQLGNFAVAGHRGTRGPLAPLLDLRAGDEVVVETADAIFTYALTNNPAEMTVKDTDTWVLQPVPGHPEVRPTEALLTLTTCHDLFRSDNRAIAFATLVSTQQK